MKIGIDATPLTTHFPCGTKVYAQNLLDNLAKIDSINEYIIFATKNVLIPKQKNFRFVKIPSFLPFLKRQIFIPILVKREKIDIFHNLEPFGSIFLCHNKIITTVHDINLNKTYPFFSKYFINRIYCEITRKIVLQKSHKIITVSKSIADELNAFIKTNIKVVYNSYNKETFRCFKEKVKKTGVLCMGDFAIRKNIVRTIEAYSILPEKFKKNNPLQIITSTVESRNKFIKIVNKFKIEKYSKIYIEINNAGLANLYNRSLVFVYPSLYEGFGIPILEAMACGCPVITSNYGAMREIAGGAAILVSPTSLISIKKAILKISSSKKLRKNIILKGIIRSNQFNWEKSAREVLKSYRTMTNI